MRLTRRSLDTGYSDENALLVSFDEELTDSDDFKWIAFEVWEVKEEIRVEKVIPPKSDEDEDEVEVKHRTLS